MNIEYRAMRLSFLIAAFLTIFVGVADATTTTQNIAITVTAPTNISIWTPSTVPASPNNNDGQAIEVGTKFQTNTAGQVTALRFYKGTANTGTHVGSLWSNTGTLLAQVTYSGETASGWQQQALTSPVTLTPNTTYVVSVHSTGEYAGDSSYFTTAHTNGPLTGLANGSVSPGNGVYLYTASSAFPTNTFSSTNYYADVVFTYTPAPQTPTAISLNPSSITVGDNCTTTPGNCTLSAISVTTSDGLAFGGSLTLTANPGTRVAISGNNLVPAHNYMSADDGSALTVTVQASENGATKTANLTLTVQAQTIASVSLSNSTFVGGSPSGTTVGALSAVLSPTIPALSPTFSLSTTATNCTPTNGANNSSFQTSGSNLQTNGVVANGTYQACVAATVAGASNSPFGQPFTLTGQTVTTQVPGPSQALFSSPPYVCSNNRYVAGTAGDGFSPAGSSSNSGTSAAAPWDIQTALNYAAPAGTCITMADGSYHITVGTTSNNGTLVMTHGGNAATPSGYVVWKGTSITNGIPNAHLIETRSGSAGDIINPAAAYLWYDGLQLDGVQISATSATQRRNCISPNVVGRIGVQFHHLWLTNSYIHGCGQSDAQYNDSEYFYFYHNTFGPSAFDDAFSVASNVSIYEPIALCTSASAPYPSCTSIPGEITYATRTTCNSGTDPTGCAGNTKYAYDNYWCSTGAYPYCYNIVFAYNVTWGSYNPAANTDGEGLIFDDWNGDQSSNGACPVSGGSCTFPDNGLVMGNVVYFNGSGGIYTFVGGPNSGHVVYVNNTTYDNNVDTTQGGSFRSGLENYGWDPMIAINNVGYGVVGAGSTALNSAFGNCCNATTTPNIWQNNVGYAPGYNVFDPQNSGSGTGQVNLDSFPTSGACATTNTCNVSGSNPLFVNATPGTFSTHTPGNSNFALCTASGTPAGCTGKSPAVGVGQAFSLWQQTTPGSIDAGACVSGLTTCP